MQESTIRDKKSIQQLYNEILPMLAQHIHKNIEPVLPLFENFTLERLLDTWTKDPAADPDKEVSIDNGNVQYLGLILRLEGFNKPGIEPFDLRKDLLFKLEYNHYTAGPDKTTAWLEKDYLQRWETADYETIATRFCEDIVDEITDRLNK